jgi:hypothetical protein
LILSATTLAALLIIGEVEINPGPGVKTEKIMLVLCSGCDKNLKSGTQCDTCGRWFHNSCGNVKVQVAESGKYVCVKCRSERICVFEEKLQEALNQIDALTRKNKTLEEQRRLTTDGREVSMSDNVKGHPKSGECLVLVDSIIRKVGTECSGLKVECFPGIRTEQLRMVIVNRDFGSPEAVVIN